MYVVIPAGSTYGNTLAFRAALNGTEAGQWSYQQNAYGDEWKVFPDLDRFPREIEDQAFGTANGRPTGRGNSVAARFRAGGEGEIDLPMDFMLVDHANQFRSPIHFPTSSCTPAVLYGRGTNAIHGRPEPRTAVAIHKAPGTSWNAVLRAAGLDTGQPIAVCCPDFAAVRREMKAAGVDIRGLVAEGVLGGNMTFDVANAREVPPRVEAPEDPRPGREDRGPRHDQRDGVPDGDLEVGGNDDGQPVDEPPRADHGRDRGR